MSQIDIPKLDNLFPLRSQDKIHKITLYKRLKTLEYLHILNEFKEFMVEQFNKKEYVVRCLLGGCS